MYSYDEAIAYLKRRAQTGMTKQGREMQETLEFYVNQAGVLKELCERYQNEIVPGYREKIEELEAKLREYEGDKYEEG